MSRAGLLSLLLAFGVFCAGSAADTWAHRSRRRSIPRPMSPAINEPWSSYGTARSSPPAPANIVQIPKGARISECSGGVVTAGFQNSHVHFMEAALERCGPRSRGRAHPPTRGHADPVRLHHGVRYRLGSVRTPLRCATRIEKGEMRGPRILTAGIALYPPDGIPFYLRDLPPERARADSAAAKKRRRGARGCARRTSPAARMAPSSSCTPRRTGRSAFHVDRSGARGRGRNSRAGQTGVGPSDQPRWRSRRAGRRASTSSCTPRWVKPRRGTRRVLAEMKAKHMSVIPTFKLWPYELRKDGRAAGSRRQTGRRHAAGAAEFFRGGRAGALRHRRRVHARIRSHATNTMFMAQAGLCAHADPRVAHHGAGRTLE